MRAVKIAIASAMLCFLYAVVNKDAIFLAVLIAWIFQCGKNKEE